MINRSFIYKEKEIILTLYKSLVRPHLEYGNNIWFPFLKRQSLAIEQVQRRATRLIPGLKNLSYHQRLSELKLPSLKFRRIRGDLIQAYKVFNKVDDLKVDDIFKLNHYDKTRNSLFKIFITQSNTNKKKYSYNNRVARYWNNLSNCSKTANSTNTFKNLLAKEKDINDLIYQYDV